MEHGSSAWPLDTTVTISVAVLGTAIVVFVSTNIDDIVLLAVLYGDRRLRRTAVTTGQFLGIAALTAVSIVAAAGALAVPAGWPALLGVIPLCMGLWQLVRLLLRKSIAEEEGAAQPLLEGRLLPQVVSVAAITIANGGDNLSVYIPVFANNFDSVPLFAAAFALLTAAWCLLGWAAVRNPLLGRAMQRQGHIILPVVLVAIGIQILWGARVIWEETPAG